MEPSVTINSGEFIVFIKPRDSLLDPGRDDRWKSLNKSTDKQERDILVYLR